MPTVKLDALAVTLPLLMKQAPRDRLKAIQLVRAEIVGAAGRLDNLRAETILELRAETPPAQWAELGELLGVTAQRAHQLAADYLAKRLR